MSSFNTDSLKDFSKSSRTQFFNNFILSSDDDLHLCMLSERVEITIINKKMLYFFFNLRCLSVTTIKVQKRPKMNVNLIIIGRILFECSFSEYIIMRKSQLAMHKTQSTWSISQVNALRKFKNKLFETESEQIAEKMLQKQDNNMQFYQITPKDELPKNLQKMNFQTLNTKENLIEGIVKVHKKHNLNKKQEQIRKMLRNSGQIMLLSEIYNYLDDSFQPKVIQKQNNIQATPLSNVISQLDQWEKSTCKKGTLEARFSKLRLPNLSIEDRRNSSHKKEFVTKKFKLGSDYKTEIEKNLQTINFSYKNQQNLLSRYNMIQNSSKMLKKELEEMKEIVKKQIEQKMKKLAESRKEHHRLYEEKLKLQIQEQELDLQIAKQEANSMYSSGYGFHTFTQSNMKIVFEDKRNELEKNQVKINKIKKNIELLEQQTFKNQEQLKNILMAQNIYFKISLRNGIDCRDSGLVWIIKKLKIQESDISNIEFPDYLDRKSKAYLMNKAKSEQVLEQVLQEKRIFITEVGKQSEPEARSSFRSPSRKSSIKLEKAIQKSQIIDEIKQVNNSVQCESDIPKRYSRSLKKITALREEYLKNENLFKLTQGRGGLKFGNNLTGMTGKQIYENIGEKIKQVDFSKLKKQKAQQKSDKLFEYQAILKKIEQLHMQIEEQDLQHEAHLLSQYKDEKDLFFRLAAACFGVKRAYSLIIKNFSWKNTI